MKIDLDQTKTLTYWQIIQLIIYCCAIVALFTILNIAVGATIISIAIFFVALKIWSKYRDD